MGLSYCKRNLVDIFYHIRQVVAARVAMLVLGCIWYPHFEEEKVVGVSDGTIRMSVGGFLYRLFIVTTAPSLSFGRNLLLNVSDAEIDIGGSITLGQKLGRKWLTDISQILTHSGRD